jgi:hypothetical protein
LKIPKSVIKNRTEKKYRQYNDQKIKDRRTNNYLQNITQKTKDRATRAKLKSRVSSGVPKGQNVPAPHMVLVVLILLQTR